MFTPSESIISPDLGHKWFAEKTVKEGLDFVIYISWGKKPIEFI